MEIRADRQHCPIESLARTCCRVLTCMCTDGVVQYMQQIADLLGKNG